MRLNQITAPATNMEESIFFYEVMGLKLIVRTATYARLETDDGALTFSLHLTDQPSAREHGHSLYFECADLDATVANLKDCGWAFESDPTDQTWLWREAWMRDPAGNRVCLYFAGENRRHPPWRLRDEENIHIIIGDRILLVRNFEKDILGDYPDALTSMGPMFPSEIASFIQQEWPDIFAANEAAIHAYASGDAETLQL